MIILKRFGRLLCPFKKSVCIIGTGSTSRTNDAGPVIHTFVGRRMLRTVPTNSKVFLPRFMIMREM